MYNPRAEQSWQGELIYIILDELMYNSLDV